MTAVSGTGAEGGLGSPTATLDEVTKLVKRAGLMDLQPAYYVFKIIANLVLLAAAWTAFALLGDSWWQLAVAAFLALCFGQTDLIGHDAGHRQIFRTRKGSDVIGYFHGNLLTGVSFGWWVQHHTKHHNFPNHLSLDPDITRRQVIFDVKHRTKKTSTMARFIVRHQAWMFYVVIMLEGLRMHLSGYVAARLGVIKRHLVADLVLLTVHLVAYLAAVFLVLPPLKAVAFIVVHQALFGFYMGLLFAPNHKGLPVRDGDAEELDWLTRQVVTSRNILPNRVTDFFYGGLNYQIEHHLFPSMPRRNLRRSQPMIKEYLVGHGMPYVEVSLMRSYLDVSEYLGEVGDEVADLERTGRLQVGGT
ncbi:MULTISPECIES: fatty acid desaturase family protein [Streptomyces]|uniref:Fatty acid desaturase n=1 Tax=Streptomyces albus (strain ATCC 21838 / DSM 41398 / FERM P-419 / JCM 4703 / NBRC 107858) TaxID=1081613 RepID=A0A0B5F4S9_STRA4|nr:acyl-CoA desaturase [Streptomyces sp. SCSIO ZS0520]AJE85317.1 fatty acid desaturase [Streptomyces albus]AOU79624.1 fatty acid desaturase [Streptomyces albus]AYN35347.1 acyl-CoA desaturase [Streptomyces albus]